MQVPALGARVHPVTHIARDAEVLSSSKYQASGDAIMGKNLLSMDPPLTGPGLVPLSPLNLTSCAFSDLKGALNFLSASLTPANLSTKNIGVLLPQQRRHHVPRDEPLYSPHETRRAKWEF